MSSPAAEMVAAFHEALGQRYGDGGTNMRDRIRLHREEARELIKALRSGDPVAIAREAADNLYVIYGTAFSLGLPLDAVVAAVHRANMTKIDDEGNIVIDRCGKAIKTRHFRPANIPATLALFAGVPPVRNARLDHDPAYRLHMAHSPTDCPLGCPYAVDQDDAGVPLGVRHSDAGGEHDTDAGGNCRNPDCYYNADVAYDDQVNAYLDGRAPNPWGIDETSDSGVDDAPSGPNLGLGEVRDALRPRPIAPVGTTATWVDEDGRRRCTCGHEPHVGQCGASARCPCGWVGPEVDPAGADAVAAVLDDMVAEVDSRYPMMRRPDPRSDWSAGVAWLLERLSATARQRREMAASLRTVSDNADRERQCEQRGLT